MSVVLSISFSFMLINVMKLDLNLIRENNIHRNFETKLNVLNTSLNILLNDLT